MKSIVVMTMTIIAICAIPSDAEKLWPFVEDTEYIFPADNHGRCPSIETASVHVFNGSDSSSVKSCASFNFTSLDENVGTKSFTLKFNRSENGTLSSCASGGDTSIENVVFPCLATHSSSENSRYSNMNVILYGRVIHPTGKRFERCAVYAKVNSENYLMAISSNSSCNNLHQMLPKEPEKDNNISEWALPL